MAFTVTTDKTVLGNKRVHLLQVTVDSASGNIDTGLKVVDHFTVAPVSANTNFGGIKFKANVGSGATSLPGIININAATSGDVFFLQVFGK